MGWILPAFCFIYGWLVLDVLTGVLTLNHVPHDIADYVRLGEHIFAGIRLDGYTFVSPFLRMTCIGPTSIFFLAWPGIVAWRNGVRRARAVAQGSSPEG